MHKKGGCKVTNPKTCKAVRAHSWLNCRRRQLTGLHAVEGFFWHRLNGVQWFRADLDTELARGRAAARRGSPLLLASAGSRSHVRAPVLVLGAAADTVIVGGGGAILAAAAVTVFLFLLPFFLLVATHMDGMGALQRQVGGIADIVGVQRGRAA